jgi:hypothetical protein
MPDFETVNESIKTQKQEKMDKITTPKKRASLRSAQQIKQMESFSIFSQNSVATKKIDCLYKRIALVVESVVLVSLLILILKKVSLFKVFNVVSAFCFPTICVITPTYYYICSIKKTRNLKFSEYFFTGSIIIVGIFILIISFINILFLE